MDVTQLLEQDHQKVEGLFADYNERQEARPWSRSAGSSRSTPTIEEEIVYPRLAELDRDLEQHAEEEHAEAKDLIAQIRANDPEHRDPRQSAEQAIKEHVSDEESQAFPLLRERLGDDLDRMGVQAQQRKQQLMGG